MKMLNKKLKLFFVFVIGFILLTVVAIGIQIALLEVRDRVYLRGNLNWATNPAYQIFVEEGQIPYQATCTVMDSQGHPMPGINVALGGYSGTQGEMVTNDQGQVTQSCSASCTQMELFKSGSMGFAHFWSVVLPGINPPVCL